MSLLIDFIDETEEVKEAIYKFDSRVGRESSPNGKDRRRSRIIGYICR